MSISLALSWGRNALESIFCWLKGFRRVVTRYDRLAIDYLAATICLAATVSYYICLDPNSLALPTAPVLTESTDWTRTYL